jgi:hypothetical protein
VKVHIPGKGFAIGPAEKDLVVSRNMTREVSATASGGPNGGFPVIFTSLSAQLGSDPAGIYARFLDPDSSEVIYVLPTTDGDSKHIRLVLCAPKLNSTQFNASAAPTIFGVDPEPYSNASAAGATEYTGAPPPLETEKHDFVLSTFGNDSKMQ